MNAGRLPISLGLLLLACGIAWADSAAGLVREGNELYGAGRYAEAVEKYDQALAEQEDSVHAQYNKANACYRLREYDQAVSLFQQAAAQAGSDLAARAKANLGNSYFRKAEALEGEQGGPAAAADPKPIVAALENAIDAWRQALELESDLKPLRRNIEVAKIKLAELQKQQQQQEQQDEQEKQGDKNRNQEEQRKDSQEQDQNQEKKDPQQDSQEESEKDRQEQQKSDPQEESEQEQKDQEPQADQQDPQEPQEKQSDSAQQQNEAAQENQKLQEARAAEEKADRIIEQEKRLRLLRLEQLRKRQQDVERDW